MNTTTNRGMAHSPAGATTRPTWRHEQVHSGLHNITESLRCECGGEADGDDCCSWCGVALVECGECEGVGYHKPNCSEIEQ